MPKPLLDTTASARAIGKSPSGPSSSSPVAFASMLNLFLVVEYAPEPSICAPIPMSNTAASKRASPLTAISPSAS